MSAERRLADLVARLRVWWPDARPTIRRLDGCRWCQEDCPGEYCDPGCELAHALWARAMRRDG